MECVIMGIPDFILAVFAIVGFLSRRNPIMYRSPWALGVGALLLITSLLEVGGVDYSWISLLEFTIILMAGIQIERFVSTNTGKKAMYWLFGLITLLVLLTVAVTGSSLYFEAGLLIILGTAAMRFSSMEMIFGTEIRFPLLTAGVMAFVSALSLFLGFRMLSAFLYTGTLVLLILTIVENVMSVKGESS
ncbi:hypothetical protein A3L09_06970 [Thermococcus profundus]|uniref:Uncharacterized protein n=1 Tax=Thermococcus profundus TaxID=49899 RepID=A0A2Z2MEE3_THEPR|nr:hypothetical protein [Thermococcus profundus]ASJ03015.1 hypothetical protein A3L09_06970 [Thermococcus profundus]